MDDLGRQGRELLSTWQTRPSERSVNPEPHKDSLQMDYPPREGLVETLSRFGSPGLRCKGVPGLIPWGVCAEQLPVVSAVDQPGRGAVPTWSKCSAICHLLNGANAVPRRNPPSASPGSLVEPFIFSSGHVGADLQR